MPFNQVIGHDRQKQILQSMVCKERFGHAHLFSGNSSIGKGLIAKMFAQAINCESPQHKSDACGACRTCEEVEQSIHPDVHHIAPNREADAKSDEIKVDQIRGDVEGMLRLRSFTGGYKVCIIDDAHLMNRNAQNAFLKTLEEPPLHSIIILISDKPQSLAPTILSRCQKLWFAPLSAIEIQMALEARQNTRERARFVSQLSQGRIGKALSINPDEMLEARDHIITTIGLDSFMHGGIAHLFAASEVLLSENTPLTDSEALSGGEKFRFGKSKRAAAALTWLSHWLRDILILQVSKKTERIMNYDRLKELTQAGNQCTPSAIINLLKNIEVTHQNLRRNLNPTLQMEMFLLRLYNVFSTKTIS